MTAAREADRSVSGRQSRQRFHAACVQARRRFELFKLRVKPALYLMDRLAANHLFVWTYKLVVRIVVGYAAVKLVGLDVIVKVLPLVR